MFWNTLQTSNYREISLLWADMRTLQRQHHPWPADFRRNYLISLQLLLLLHVNSFCQQVRGDGGSSPSFNLEWECSVIRGSKAMLQKSCRPKWRGLDMDYLCSDSWMENTTPDVDDFCWMEAKKVNSLLLLNSCTTFSVMCAGAWTALPTSEE